MRKLTIFIVVIACLCSACGARDDASYGRVTAELPGGFELPPVTEAVATFALFPHGHLRTGTVRSVERLAGVVATAKVRVAQVDVEGPAGAIPLQVGAVAPLEFRSVAPAPTRAADFVWTSLLGGQAIVTYRAAGDLGVDDGASLEVPGIGRVRVGAFAENGVPTNFADVLVSDHIVEDLPGEPIDLLVVGTDGDADTDALGRTLSQIDPRAEVVPLIQVIGNEAVAAEAAPQPVARGTAERGLGGTMTFTVLKNGWIRPDQAWVDANIAQATVPILGEVTCHRLMIPQLAGALGEIERRDLAELIRPEDYAGCYAPRFIDRDPSLPLSNHAFGLAIDLNADTNQLGTTGDMDPRVVEIFEKWGFEWGGNWERPDPMHFELARLLP